MKILKKAGFLLALLGPLATSGIAHAATSPNLGLASPYTVLSATYANTASGTVLNGDLGYTTGPAVQPTVNGNTHVADATYNQAGIDQGTALSQLNSQPCTFNFAPGVVDLATDTTHGTVGVYTPGVYCMSGAATIGGGGTITLTGGGTYIFRMDGALTSSANSIVTASEASACNVWWTPTSATTLGANSTFIGTVIDPSGVTIGDTVAWNGRALAFGGTVSTTRDAVNTVPTCSTASVANPLASANVNVASTPKLPNTGNGPIRHDTTGIISMSAIALTAVVAAYLNRRGLQSLIGRA
jgi:hypothetical protein